MASSKRDKLTQVARRQMESSSSTRSPDEGLPPSLQSNPPSEKTAPSSQSSRQSIYNVSNDILLEEHIEDPTENTSRLDFLKIFVGIIAILGIGYGSVRLISFLKDPNYILTVSNEYTEGASKKPSSSSSRAISSNQPVYIRFQWAKGRLKTDYIRIEVYKISGKKKIEEAVIGRRKPKTANYIYFMGPLDKGNYHLRVLNRKSKLLSNKKFKVQ